ncbi:MAG: hypothetical protein H6707_02800 [Deltaproteobacteria bacterium]|nr:hypothetical protein [Deltaproteobacteria bacterium]
MKRTSIAIASMLGALTLYCGQSAINSLDGGTADGAHLSDGRFVRDAIAAGDTCCAAPAYQFTKLAEFTLNGGQHSQPIDVGGYREVVIYDQSVTCGGSSTDTTYAALSAEFRPDSGTMWGRVNVGTITYGARIQVQGAQMRLFAALRESNRPCVHKLAVAGVR